MGAGASAGLAAGLKAASQEELGALLAEMSQEDRNKLTAALEEQPNLKQAPTQPFLSKHVSQIDGSKPRLLIVTDTIPETELLLACLKDNVTAVIVDFDSWTIDDLTNEIKEQVGNPVKQLASIGIVDHGGPGNFRLLKSLGDGSLDLQTIKSSPAIQEFFKLLASYVQAPTQLHKWREDLACRIDLMACEVARGPTGEQLIRFLEDLTEVNWAASVNKTGHASLDGDWVMETEANLGSVDACYFHPEQLADWKHACGGWGWIGNTVGAVAGAAAGVAMAPILLPSVAAGGVVCAVVGATAGSACAALNQAAGASEAQAKAKAKAKALPKKP